MHVLITPTGSNSPLAPQLFRPRLADVNFIIHNNFQKIFPRDINNLKTIPTKHHTIEAIPCPPGANSQ